MNDLNDAGLSNINLDWTYNFVGVLVKYYPRGFNFLVLNLPVLLKATLNLALAVGGQEIRSKVTYVNGKEIQQYIPIEYIPGYAKDPGYNDGNIFSSFLG